MLLGYILFRFSFVSLTGSNEIQCEYKGVLGIPFNQAPKFKQIQNMYLYLLSDQQSSGSISSFNYKNSQTYTFSNKINYLEVNSVDLNDIDHESHLYIGTLYKKNVYFILFYFILFS